MTVENRMVTKMNARTTYARLSEFDGRLIVIFGRDTVG